MSAALLAAQHLAATAAAALALGSPQQIHVLVVKATWGPTPAADADVQATAEAAGAFLEQASFGAVHLTFTQTPWVTAYADDTACTSVQRLVDEGAAAAAVYAPDSYDRRVYVTPCNRSSEGSPLTHNVVIGTRLTESLLEHELGHTFGMSHAGSLECGRRGRGCTLDPYANPFDVMGDGRGDPGALQKAEAGWLRNYRTVTVPGTYTLAALEVPSALPQALVVERGRVELWIEHREAIGNDAYLRTSIWHRVTSGVLVHEAPADSVRLPFSQRRPDFLLGSGGPTGPWIAKGRTFKIPHVMAIDVLKHVGTTVRVRLRALR